VASDIQQCVRTLRLKVKPEGYVWLNAAAIEINQVWNFSNAASYKAARPFAGQPRYLSAFDLDKLTAGATDYFEHIGSDGRCVLIVDERNTTRTCSSCKALTGPAGLDMLVVRTWVCSVCGDTHDRDVNAARNILSAGRSPPSVCGNEPPLSVAPPSQTSSRCEAGTSTLKAAA
jgi:hypothetical protein